MSFKRTPNVEWDAMQELVEIPQWVIWKEVQVSGGKMTKPPFHISGKYRADPTNPAHFSSFQQVCDFVMDADNDEKWGVGFSLTENDAYVAVDLDKCINPENGAISEEIRTIIERFDSATEVSPSGKGFHIICKGKLPPGSWHKNSQLGYEIYDRKRYITVTGDHYEGTPEVIGERQEAIDWFLETFRPSKETIANDDFKSNPEFNIFIGDANAEAPGSKLKALKSNNINFRKLWDRDRQDFEGKSFSEYDMGLCYHMVSAKWTPQEIANTLIHYRRTWGSDEEHQKVLTRLDYHERTQKNAKLAVSKNYTDFAADIEVAIEEDDQESCLGILVDKTGIPCTKIIRRGVDPVKFYFVIDGRDRCIGGGKELLSQNHVRAKVVEACGYVMKMFTGGMWHKMITLLYSASEFEEFEEVDKVKSFLAAIRDYLDSNSNNIIDDNEQSIAKKWPFLIKDVVYISAEEFHLFVTRQRGQKIELNDLRYQFRESGFKSKRMNTRYSGKPTSRSFWCIDKKELEDGEFIPSARPTRNRKDRLPVKEGSGSSGGDRRKQIGDDMLTH